MSQRQSQPEIPFSERRRYPRFELQARINLAVEDESINESIGIGEAADISLGGLRVRNLPRHTEVRAGHILGLLLIAEDQALSLSAEVVHHGTSDSFGVEFRHLSATAQEDVSRLVRRAFTS
jgi:c-di-GMP-binding flagellar brake protein YcgR